MPILVSPVTITGTASAGAFSANSPEVQGDLGNLLVKPTSAGTTYDVSITDNSNIVIYERTSEVGAMSEELHLPVHGIYTVAIANATANEAFTIKMMLRH